MYSGIACSLQLAMQLQGMAGYSRDDGTSGKAAYSETHSDSGYRRIAPLTATAIAIRYVAAGCLACGGYY